MTKYHCPRHGDIGGDVLDTHALFGAAWKPNTAVSAAALPKQKHVCARCVAALIDDHFAPVRERG